MTAPELQVIESTALDATRRRALRAMLDAAYDGDFADQDWWHALGGTHFLIEGAEGVRAHAALVRRPIRCDGRVLQVGYVEAVATAAAFRRRGLASALMQRVGARVQAEYELGLLSTGEHGFYAAHGWERWLGPSFVDGPNGCERTADDDDGLMYLRTSRTPPLDPTGGIVADWRDGDVW